MFAIGTRRSSCWFRSTGSWCFHETQKTSLTLVKPPEFGSQYRELFAVMAVLTACTLTLTLPIPLPPVSVAVPQMVPAVQR